jgi:Family of unknown function (DUF6065)
VSEAPDRRELIAFHVGDHPERLPAVMPAPRWRDWMNATPGRFANRCLPLLVANEAGWVILNPIGFTATWDGGPERSAVTVEFEEGEIPPAGSASVDGHFGHGILTWGVPYLFRTPPGYNLLARGPANWPKDGIAALEGLVETDWSTAQFTMNWKFTRPDNPVTFERGEPFCMIVPQRRGELESFDPTIQHARADPETAEGWKAWGESRDRLQIDKFLSEYSNEYAEARDAWERNYFKGALPGRTAPEHQTKLRLREFELRR